MADVDETICRLVDVADAVVEGWGAAVVASILSVPWPVDRLVFAEQVLVHCLGDLVLLRDFGQWSLVESGHRAVGGRIEVRVVGTVDFGPGVVLLVTPRPRRI